MTWTQVAVPDRMPTGAQPGERILGQVSDEPPAERKLRHRDSPAATTIASVAATWCRIPRLARVTDLPEHIRQAGPLAGQRQRVGPHPRG